MKNVVILSASPRKNGNSDILCQEFKRGAEETGKCVQKDDMEQILEKIQAADVILVATPTYFLSMNGMLKTTIDRFLPKWTNLGGHDVYFIITGHDAKKGEVTTTKAMNDTYQMGINC
jgi:multimeric flavodoxin WrbA